MGAGWGGGPGNVAGPPARKRAAAEPGTEPQPDASDRLDADALARLDAEILRAHAAGNATALAALYLRGAKAVLAERGLVHGCFLATQAYVNALRAGEEAIAEEAHALLRAHGAEE